MNNAVFIKLLYLDKKFATIFVFELIRNIMPVQYISFA